MIQQGSPKTSNTTAPAKTLRIVRQKDNPRLMSEKRIAAILRRSPREVGKESWNREVDNTELWRVFGLNSKAGRILKRVYTTPLPGTSRQSTPLRTPMSRGRSPMSRGLTYTGPLIGSIEEDVSPVTGCSLRTE